MFTDSVARGEATSWLIDLAPMLADTSFQQTLANFNIETPQSLTVPGHRADAQASAARSAAAGSDLGAVGECRRRRS